MKIITTLLSLLLLMSSPAVNACRCVEPSVQTAFNQADLVVRATAKEVISIPEGDGVSVLLDVSRSWKKTTTNKIILNSITSCFFPFDKDQAYILFLTIEPNGLYSTDRCQGNRLLSESDELAKWLDNADKK